MTFSGFLIIPIGGALPHGGSLPVGPGYREGLLDAELSQAPPQNAIKIDRNP